MCCCLILKLLKYYRFNKMIFTLRPSLSNIKQCPDNHPELWTHISSAFHKDSSVLLKIIQICLMFLGVWLITNPFHKSPEEKASDDVVTFGICRNTQRFLSERSSVSLRMLWTRVFEVLGLERPSVLHQLGSWSSPSDREQSRWTTPHELPINPLRSQGPSQTFITPFQLKRLNKMIK